MLAKEDLKVILKEVLALLGVIGGLMLVPILVSIIYREFSVIPFFLLTAAPLMALGFYSKKIKIELNTELKHAMIIVSIIWLLLALVSAVPLWQYTKASYLDSFFEMMSAWTTTGFSIFDAETLPKTFLFFRSFAQWIGGLGIVVLALAGIFKVTALYTAEAREEKIKPGIISTVKTMWWIYIVLTVTGAVLFYLIGMPAFDSVNHSMTALATGGMTIKNSSIGAYKNPLIYLVSIVLMLAGATSFAVYYSIFKLKLKKAFSDFQLRYLFFFAVFGIVLLLFQKLNLIDTVFQVVSAVTNTGFSTVNLSNLSDYGKFLLAALMVVGGAAGSTAGGIKIFRAVVVLKNIWWNIKGVLLPRRALITKKINSHVLEENELTSITTFVLLYFVFLFIIAVVLMSLGYTTADSIFEVASAQGNTGLSIGIVSPTLHPIGKIALIFSMWIGRLEIWAILILFGSIIARRY